MSARWCGTTFARSPAVLSLVALALTTACSSDTPASQQPTRPPSSSTSPAGSAAPPTQGTGPGRQPNVLVITADDLRADDLRWMPRTRRLLGGHGLTFLNSFSPNPLCCPDRASFLTGKYSHNHRVLSHAEPYGFGAFDDSATLATVLTQAGYRTALVGKYLNGYGEQPTYATHADSLHYIPPGWSQWYGSTDHEWQPGEHGHGGTYHYFSLASNVNGRIRHFDGQYTTRVTSQQTRHLLTRFSALRPAKPWFIWWTPVAPHTGGPVEPDDPKADHRVDGHRVEWPTPARPGWVKGMFDDQITHGAGTPPQRPAERDVSDKPLYVRDFPPLTTSEKRSVMEVTRQRAEAAYVLDVQIAGTLRALRRTGEASHTVVVVNSDNGYYLGEHRKRQGKVTLHEPSIRVPMLMSGPGVPRGRRFDPVTPEDLAVTIARWAGARLPDADGSDLRRTISRGDQGWTRPVVIEGLMSEHRYAHHHVDASVMQGLNTVGIRTARWKLVRYSTGESELYDLRRDPLELHSLHGPSTRAVRAGLTALWRAYAACAGPSCRTALPEAFRVGPRSTARITRHQDRARARYFQY